MTVTFDAEQEFNGTQLDSPTLSPANQTRSPYLSTKARTENRQKPQNQGSARTKSQENYFSEPLHPALDILSFFFPLPCYSQSLVASPPTSVHLENTFERTWPPFCF